MMDHGLPDDDGTAAERKMRFLFALRTKGVTDARVLTAMERIDRGQFVRLTAQPQIHLAQLMLQGAFAGVFGGPVQGLYPRAAVGAPQLKEFTKLVVHAAAAHGHLLSIGLHTPGSAHDSNRTAVCCCQSGEYV